MTSLKSVVTHQSSMLTPAEELELRRIDLDGDGIISTEEARAAARSAAQLRVSISRMWKLVIGVFALLFLSWAGNAGLMIAVVNLSKDVKVEGGSLKDRQGASIRTHNQENVYTATVPTADSRRKLSAGVVATVPWATVNQAIVNIQEGETGGVISTPLCDGSTAIHSMGSTSYYTTNAAGNFGLGEVYLSNDNTVAYDVSCESASSTGDYECPVVVSATTARRALSFEDAFDGDLDAHAKNSRRLASIKDCISNNSPAAVNLGTAGNFVILTKTGVTNTGLTAITGDMGSSPIASTAMTGFALTMDATNLFSKSSLVTGNVYAASYAVPTPSTMSIAISDMQTAYVDAAGRVGPDVLDLGAGLIDGDTLTSGLYKWGTSVDFSTLTFSGDANARWILQISQDLRVGAGAVITLAGGAKAENIVWQIAGKTTVYTTAAMQGIILCATSITFMTGSSLNGAALSQTAVTLDTAAISA